MFDRLKLSFIIFKEIFCRRLYYWKKSKYFIEWDYTSILLAEKAAIERMLKTYKNTDEMSKYTIDRLQLALNLLDIILGNKEITIIFVLHLQKTFHCSKIIAQMQIACRANSTNNCFHKKGIH